jgi:hypothetical protein
MKQQRKRFRNKKKRCKRCSKRDRLDDNTFPWEDLNERTNDQVVGGNETDLIAVVVAIFKLGSFDPLLNRICRLIQFKSGSSFYWRNLLLASGKKWLQVDTLR